MALYSNVFKTDETPGPQSAQKEVKTDLPAALSVSICSGQGRSIRSGVRLFLTRNLPNASAPDGSGEITEEKAIEMVKSPALPEHF
jgi:hypothetical protein